MDTKNNNTNVSTNANVNNGNTNVNTCAKTNIPQTILQPLPAAAPLQMTLPLPLPLKPITYNNANQMPHNNNNSNNNNSNNNPAASSMLTSFAQSGQPLPTLSSNPGTTTTTQPNQLLKIDAPLPLRQGVAPLQSNQQQQLNNNNKVIFPTNQQQTFHPLPTQAQLMQPINKLPTNIAARPGMYSLTSQQQQQQQQQQQRVSINTFTGSSQQQPYITQASNNNNNNNNNSIVKREVPLSSWRLTTGVFSNVKPTLALLNTAQHMLQQQQQPPPLQPQVITAHSVQSQLRMARQQVQQQQQQLPLEGSIVACALEGSMSLQQQQPLMVTQSFARHLRQLRLAQLLASGTTTTTATTTTATVKIKTEEKESLTSVLQRQLAQRVFEQQQQQHQQHSKDKKDDITLINSNKPINHSNNIGNGKSMESESTTMVAPHSYFARQSKLRRDKKQDRQQWWSEDKVERRRQQAVEDAKRRRWLELQKQLLAHREEFARFHRNRRVDLAKVTRSVRSVQEQVEKRVEREEGRAEARRLQALRENDLEAYSQLLQQTKNDRLHFLVKETESYISKINELVLSNQQQQEEEEEELQKQQQDNNNNSSQTLGANAAAAAAAATTSLKKSTSIAKEYYASTHRRTETVTQPSTLCGGDLKEYQLSGVQWMVSLYNNNLNGILADEMGLGKTIQTIALLAYLMESKGNRGPFMVVVPLSTLSNWVNEFTKWAPHIVKVVYKGAPSIRKQIVKEEIETGAFNLLLTTYEYTMKDKAALKRIPWQYIIVDEGHRMKNAESKFAQTLGTLYTSRHRLLLTGTPLQNNLPELWALLNFLLPSIFSSMDTFDQWFNRPFASFKNSNTNTGNNNNNNSNGDGEEAVVLSQEEKMLIVNRLHEVIRPFMLRRVKEQVLDQLPEKVEVVVRCALSGFQRRLYNAIHSRSVAGKEAELERALTNGNNNNIDSNNTTTTGSSSSGLNNAIMHLRKVCNHPYLFLNEWLIDEDLVRCSGKFELLDRMLPKLQAAGHRVLLFSQMTQVMTILERFFDLRGYRHLRLDGSTAAEERERRMHVFNDNESPYFLFLLSTRAGGLGLNLATADTVVLFDSDWNPMMDAQAQDRAHRIGQRNEVRVFRLTTTAAIEQRILTRATQKRTLNGLVVEAGRFGSKSGALLPEQAVGDAEREKMMHGLLQQMSSENNNNNNNNNRAGNSNNNNNNNNNNTQNSQSLNNNNNNSNVEEGEDAMDVEFTLDDTTNKNSNNNSTNNNNNNNNNDDLTNNNDFDNEDDNNTNNNNEEEDALGEVEEIEEEEEDLLLLPSDEQLNEMMATSEAEMRLYRHIDAQRQQQQQQQQQQQGRGGGGGLMVGEEVPAWLQRHHWSAKNALLLDCITQDSNNNNNNNNKSGGSKSSSSLMDLEDSVDNNNNNNNNNGSSSGKLMRKRKEAVVYDDGLTETQFLRLVERGSDNNNNNNNNSAKNNAASSSLSLSRERGGGSAASVLAAARSSLFDHNQQQQQQQQQHSFVRALTPAEALSLEQLLRACFVNLRSTDGLDRDPSLLFQSKPDKKQYPDYYQLVPSVISLKEIHSCAKRREYRCLLELEFDLLLLTLNARTYNSEASFVFADAQQLRHSFYSHLLQSTLLSDFVLNNNSNNRKEEEENDNEDNSNNNSNSDSVLLLPPLPESYDALLASASAGRFLHTHSLFVRGTIVDTTTTTMSATSSAKKPTTTAAAARKRKNVSTTTAEASEEETPLKVAATTTTTTTAAATTTGEDAGTERLVFTIPRRSSLPKS